MNGEQNVIYASAIAVLNEEREMQQFVFVEDLNYNIIERIVELLCNETVPKIQNFYEKVVPAFNFSTFKSHFRITPTAFEFILSEICHCQELHKRDRLEFGGRDQINVEKALLITLWTLATPESYRSIGCRFNVTKSSVFTCLHNLVQVIITYLCKLFIKWPAVEERYNAALEFGRYGLVNVIGAVDGCHIPIKRPSEHGEDYFNRKKFYSVVLQGVCKANLMFTDVDVRWPGSVHDARVFRTSDIYTHGEELCSPNFYIIGDAAYPCKNWIIPPYINNGHLTQRQLYFNTQLSKTRVKIEQAFGLLLGRFRRIKDRLDMGNVQKIMNTIIACCVLHNICLLQGDDDIEQYIREGLNNLVLAELDNANGHNNGHRPGFEMRNLLCNNLWNRRQNGRNN